MRRSPTALWRSVLDEVVVALPGRDDIQRLTGPAATAWLLLERPIAVPDLVDELARIYGVPRSRIEPEVERVITDLVGRGSIERGGQD